MKKLSAAERKLAIVEAAVSLFSQKGFGRTTTRELAKHAGVSEALLFRHFPDKKSLYEEILTAKMEERCSAILETIDENQEPEDVLCALGLRICEENIQDSSFLRLLLFSALEGHELSDLFFGNRNLPVVNFLKDYFKNGEKEGIFELSDPVLAAHSFLNMIHGFLNAYLLFRIPELKKRSVEKTIQQYVRLFLKGISS